MKRRKLLWYGLLFLAGCSAGKNSPNNSLKPPASAPEKLRFAVTDVHNLEELNRDFGPFRQTLEEVLQVQVEFFTVANFTEAIPALLSNRVDLIMAGPSEYVLLNARANAVPVVSVTRPNYHSVLAVRAEDKIESLGQLKGKTIGMWKVGSTAGHLGTTKVLIDAGLEPKSDYKVVMLGKNCLTALKKGEVAACGLSTFNYEDLLAAEGASEEDFPLIAKGSSLPNDVFVANSFLAPDFVEYMRSQILANEDKLLNGLLEPEANDRFKGVKLVGSKDEDYEMIREVYRGIGEENLIE